MTGLAERLREKAREYELNKLAAEDRHDPAAPSFATVAVTLYEVADALEDDE
jgi:hypothetical protein